MLAFQPNTHRWVQGEVVCLEQNIAILEVSLGRCWASDRLECLSQDNLARGPLRKDNRQVVVLGHNCDSPVVVVKSMNYSSVLREILAQLGCGFMVSMLVGLGMLKN